METSGLSAHSRQTPLGGESVDGVHEGRLLHTHKENAVGLLRAYDQWYVGVTLADRTLFKSSTGAATIPLRYHDTGCCS